MSGIRSSDGYLGIGKQSVHETAVAPTKFVRITGPESVNHAQNILEVPSLNSGQEIEDIYKTLHVVDGGFAAYARPDLAPFLLAAVLGADTVTTGTVNTHAIKRANEIPWLTIERKLSSNERIKGCKINQLVISGQAGQPISMDATFMGTEVAIESAGSPSYETEAAWKFFEGIYKVDTVANTLITAFTLTINRNLESIQTTKQVRNNLLEARFTAELEFTIKVENDDLYKKILFGGAAAITEELDTGSFEVDFTRGAGATERQLKIALPAIRYVTAEKHLDPDSKATMLNVTAKAVWGAATEVIEVAAKNTVATSYI